jgi:ADP-ribose pyrophosphatase YjhB (NUDIX family)
MSGEGRFQVAVGAIVQHITTGEVLLIHRSASQYAGDIWEFPIGRLQQFEPFEKGLKREIVEETGLSDVEIGQPISIFEFMRGEESAEASTACLHKYESFFNSR